MAGGVGRANESITEEAEAAVAVPEGSTGMLCGPLAKKED